MDAEEVLQILVAPGVCVQRSGPVGVHPVELGRQGLLQGLQRGVVSAAGDAAGGGDPGAGHSQVKGHKVAVVAEEGGEGLGRRLIGAAGERAVHLP